MDSTPYWEQAGEKRHLAGRRGEIHFCYPFISKGQSFAMIYYHVLSFVFAHTIRYRRNKNQLREIKVIKWMKYIGIACYDR